jgi:putative PIN family toxin of toxin-antitoxin system
MITVVIDTSVYISALVFGGIPRAAVIKAMTSPYHLVVSRSIQIELVRVLANKFGWEEHRILAAQSYLWASASIVVPADLKIARDSNDDHVLGCAVAADAIYLISGDQDLLVLNPYERITILNPVDFLCVTQETIV